MTAEAVRAALLARAARYDMLRERLAEARRA